MSTRKNLIVAGCYAGVLALGMIIGPKFQRENNNSRNGTFIPFLPGGREEKTERILRIIEENYVDTVNVDSLQNNAINEVLNGLDPHSAYLPPVEARQFSDDLEGNYNGIGIEYYLLNDTLLITSVHPGGPAREAGLKTGDKVLKIGQVNIAGVGVTSAKVVELIRGRRGTSVQLAIRRPGGAPDKVVSVMRDKITVSSIDVAYMADANTGYIKISRFGSRTDEDFATEVDRLKENGMQNLILDLRGNGGGYLNAATALADEFLPDKKLIVYTRGAHEPRTDYFATEEGAFEEGGLAILIDEHTASASEIVAGAVQDLDRGIIIGRRSFGKGLVQEQFNFGDGSALNLTVARYYTPSGRSIQKPYKGGRDAYFAELRERYRRGGPDTGSLEPVDSLYTEGKRYKTSSGRLIYGGGGIMPDIHVALDTVGYNNLFFALNGKGVLLEFVFNTLISKYKPGSMDGFIRSFSVSEADYADLMRLARNKGIKGSDAEWKEARRRVSIELKALLARYYFGENGYYRTLSLQDEMITRSLEAIRRP